MDGNKLVLNKEKTKICVVTDNNNIRNNISIKILTKLSPLNTSDLLNIWGLMCMTAQNGTTIYWKEKEI